MVLLQHNLTMLAIASSICVPKQLLSCHAKGGAVLYCTVVAHFGMKQIASHPPESYNTAPPRAQCRGEFWNFKSCKRKDGFENLFLAPHSSFHGMDPTHIDLCILDLLFLSQVSLQRWGTAVPCFQRAVGGACCTCKQIHRNQRDSFPAREKGCLVHILEN